MRRMTIPMPHLTGRLLVQVAGSMAATLVGAALLMMTPNQTGSTAEPSAELTSGGKYAARILDAGPQDAGTADASARPPLPVLTRPAGLPSESRPALASASGSAWDAGPEAASARPARSKPRGIGGSADARHAGGAPGGPRHAAEAVLATALPRQGALPTAEAASPGPDEGIVSKISASARSLWSIAASTGGTVVDRLMP